MSTAVSNVGVLTVGGILASTPLGIPMEQIALGTVFAVIGVFGRAAFELQKSAEGAPGSLQIKKVLGWVGAGLIGAPFVTVTLLVVLGLLGIKSDGIVCFGLLFLGFSGPWMVTWLLNSGITQINKKSGLNLPSIGQDTTSQQSGPAVPPNNGVH